MKLAIMQPYLFPYLGYFQLINVVDIFVIYDDLQYIKKGWINRNYILVNGRAYLFTLSLQKVSSNKLIKNILIHTDSKNKEKLLKIIKHAYPKAPQYKIVSPILEKVILNDEENLSSYITFSLRKICDYLEIQTPFIVSPQLLKNDALKGEDRAIELNKRLGSTCYINPIGGVKLYNKERFKKEGIELYFFKTKNIEYKQFGNVFVPFLSIIDVLMFNSKDEVKKMLSEYELI